MPDNWQMWQARALRDEVDCLRPLERRLARCDEALSRARARLEETGDVAAQLRREEEAHAEVGDAAASCVRACACVCVCAST
jgi:hypothetical protein